MTNRFVTEHWSRDESSAGPYETVAEVQWGEANYNFNLTRVFVNTETRELFYASDSGCSCPSPFEDTTEADLVKIKRVQDWLDYVDLRLDDTVYHWNSGETRLRDYPPTVDAVASSVRSVTAALREVHE